MKKPLLLVRDEKKHSDYAASASERWLACPGSIALARIAPKKQDTEYSLEGTVGHALAEYCLKNEICPTRARIDSKSEKKLKDFVTDEMREHIKGFVAYCNNLYSTGAKFLVEVKFDLKHLGGDLGGHTDVTVIEAYGDIHVVDLKYGKGHRVDPKDNTQQIIYAIGAAELAEWDFANVHVHIYQPRISDGIGTWTLSNEELREWVEKIKKGIVAAEKKNAPLNVGDWCYFCPAKPVCPQMRDKVRDVATVEFDDAPQPLTKEAIKSRVQLLQPNEIARVLDHAEIIDDWLASVRQHAHTLLDQGKAVPGYKLVAKKANRSWKNEAKVAKEAKAKFKNKAFKTELLSPAQLEKIAGEKWVASRVEKVSSGTKVAKINDEREAEAPRIDWEFG